MTVGASGEGLAEFRVVGRAVITFAVVLPNELPIPLLDDGAFIGDFRIDQIVWGEVGLHQGCGKEQNRPAPSPGR